MGRSVRTFTETKIPVTLPDPINDEGFLIVGKAILIEKGGSTELRITLPAQSPATEGLTNIAKEGNLLGVGFYHMKATKKEVDDVDVS